MKILELFAGTRSIGKAFEARGHEVFSVEWDKNFENIDLYADIGKITAQDILDKFGRPDVIWASPDCTTFSIAAISHHRRKNEETGNLDAVVDAQAHQRIDAQFGCQQVFSLDFNLLIRSQQGIEPLDEIGKQFQEDSVKIVKQPAQVLSHG